MGWVSQLIMWILKSERNGDRGLALWQKLESRHCFKRGDEEILEQLGIK